MERTNKIIKKSPFVIIKSIVAVEITVVFAYLIVGLLGHYAKIYRSLPFSDLISFQIVQAIFVFTAQTLILVYIFIKWSSESYIIRDDGVAYSHGIWHRQEKVTAFDEIESFAWRQGPLGRIAKYGHILIKTKDGRKFSLKYVPDAKRYSAYLGNLKSIKDHSKIFRDNPDPSDLLKKEESENLELKSSFRWDFKENKINKSLEKAVMKTVAAFLNTAGGHLLIGVDNSKNIIGLEKDFASLPRQNADGFENHFTSIFHNMIGPTSRHYVRLTHVGIEGKECCVISVAPSSGPIYLKSDERNEEFYIRTGNATTALKLSEVNGYIRSRFQSPHLS